MEVSRLRELIAGHGSIYQPLSSPQLGLARLRATVYGTELRTAVCGLTADFGLRITCGLRALNCGLRIADLWTRTVDALGRLVQGIDDRFARPIEFVS